MVISILNNVVNSEEGGRGRVSHVGVWEMSFSNKENRKYSCLDLGSCLVHSKNSKEARKLEMSGWRKVEEKVKYVTGSFKDLMSQCKDVGFYSRWIEKPLEGYEQKSNMIWLIFYQNYFGCCIGIRLKGAEVEEQK